jgi:hypothetical protein
MNRSGQGKRRFLAGAITGAAHLVLFGVLLWPFAASPTRQAESEAPLEVSFVPLPQPPGPPDAADTGAPQVAMPAAPQIAAPVLTIARAADSSDLMSDSQLAGATRAGEGGGGGGGCDLARAVQQALRRDTLVHSAVLEANRLGKASLLWNGDWVRSGGQDGKGLAAVRQAVTWEVAFAPQACREARMHGLVVLSLADQRTRFAIGAGDWRWADLLGLRNPAR